MSQALFTSMTGLNSAQQSISVVSNNVANINTTAYKSADARFATLFSNTLTAGNAPSATAGGTNPKQIGLGVKLEGIVRNFETGSYLSTGRSGDSMISGRGYYTVMDPSGSVYYTRDGSFTTDADGYMVTLTGNKVLGASSLKSEVASQTPIRIPRTFSRSINGDANLADRALGDLNAASFTTGDLDLDIVASDNSSAKIKIKIIPYEEGATAGNDEVMLNEKGATSAFIAELETKIKKQIEGTAVDGKVDVSIACAAPAITDADYAEKIGTIKWTVTDTAHGAGVGKVAIADSSTSNVADCLGKYEFTQGDNYSKQLSLTVDVNPTTSPSNMTSVQSYTIGADGTIEAVYDNGDKLTVFLDDSKEFQFKYVTATAVNIIGTDGENLPSAVNVNPLLCSEESLVMQIASITNEEGLVAQADNLWSAGPDSGKIVFTVAGQMGTGKIATNGVEASNVDLARELSNMIIAQRAINANSRVFSTASSVLETLSQLGR